MGRLREAAGLAESAVLRREGAPIPLKPLPRWDDGRDVVLAGDASGVVAPASGEGIYYAMLGGRLAAEAATAFLTTGQPAALKLARKRFMGEHGRVFWSACWHDAALLVQQRPPARAPSSASARTATCSS